MNLIRDAKQSDVEFAAKLWHVGWHDAHAQIVPDQLTQTRTLERFIQRTRQYLQKIRVADDSGIKGLCLIKDDELFQLYVSPDARGTGLAKALLADAERRLILNGISRAWLACAIGNDRAAKFYRKCGWELTQTVVDDLEIPEGTFSLEVWKFEKRLLQN